MKDRGLALLIVQLALVVCLFIYFMIATKQSIPTVIKMILVMQFVVSTDLLYLYMKYLLEELPKHMDDNHKHIDFIDDLLPWSDKLPPACRKFQQN